LRKCEPKTKWLGNRLYFFYAGECTTDLDPWQCHSVWLKEDYVETAATWRTLEAAQFPPEKLFARPSVFRSKG